LIENLGGVQPQQFQFAFTFSFIISSCACVVFPKVRGRILAQQSASRRKLWFHSFDSSSQRSS
jgi:hypothetical protein